MVGFRVMDSDDLLSQYMMVGPICFLFKSSKRCHNHIASQAAEVAYIYFAFVLDKVVIYYFFEHQATAVESREKNQSIVLIVSSSGPSQSLSVYSMSLNLLLCI